MHDWKMGNSHSASTKNTKNTVLGSCAPRQAIEKDDAGTRHRRRTISKYLKRIGKQASLKLSLDVHGFCYVPFKKFLIIIGVPEEDSEVVHFKTMVFDMRSVKGNAKVQKRIAAANLTQTSLGKLGSQLYLEGYEVNLSLAIPIKNLSYRGMIDALEDFMHTALQINANLERTRR